MSHPKNIFIQPMNLQAKPPIIYKSHYAKMDKDLKDVYKINGKLSKALQLMMDIGELVKSSD